MPPKPRPRVFLDANVVFSGMYSPEGAPAIILKLFVEGRLRAVISQQVLEEVVRTIGRRLPEALPSLRKLLLSVPPEIAEDPAPEDIGFWAQLVHGDDASVLAAAVAARPDYLVTGDRHFFANPGIAEKSGLRIVTPAQFLECWDEDAAVG